MIEVEGVSKRFGGFTAIRDCSLSVPAGSITGLVGPNGAGKTTLFNIVGGALAPSGGRVRFQGRDVTGLRPFELARLGLVRTFQIPQEFSTLTVLENLMIPPPGQIGARLWAAWTRWDAVQRQEAEIAAEALEALEFLGLSHLSQERAGRLSGGQKKLLELGRAMMSGAKTVLLDEPAAGVNRTLLKTLSARLAQMRAEMGYSFFLIEHDMNLVAELCDSVYVMANGGVLAQGSMAELRRDRRVLEAYLGERGAAAPEAAS
ncbi:MAG: ABC transporter ATP-binding protein [Alphaproteobacteria bacterium]|nr:ABC transporter ATP-binding protein [Alphaproteobacteria bacterium]